LNVFRKIFETLRAEKITIDEPYELLGFPLADFRNGEKEPQVQMLANGALASSPLPISHGCNCTYLQGSIFDLVEAHCEGRVLDVGACNGKLSLRLQNAGFDIYANDISKACIAHLEAIGVKNCIAGDVRAIKGMQFDTILCIGSVLGICEELEHLDVFIDQLKSLLVENGKMIIEDHNFPFEESDQFECTLSYKNYITRSFKWCNVGSESLTASLIRNGFDAQVIYSEAPNTNYLMLATKR